MTSALKNKLCSDQILQIEEKTEKELYRLSYKADRHA